MEKYSNFISFEENFKLNEIHQKILDLALPNIIDFKLRFPDVEIKYINSIYRFEACEDAILNSLLNDICKLITDEKSLNTEQIYIQQHFEVVKILNDINNNKDYLLKRLKNYTPILDKKEREKNIIKDNNNYLFDL